MEQNIYHRPTYLIRRADRLPSDSRVIPPDRTCRNSPGPKRTPFTRRPVRFTEFCYSLEDLPVGNKKKCATPLSMEDDDRRGVVALGRSHWFSKTAQAKRDFWNRTAATICKTHFSLQTRFKSVQSSVFFQRSPRVFCEFFKKTSDCARLALLRCVVRMTGDSILAHCLEATTCLRRFTIRIRLRAINASQRKASKAPRLRRKSPPATKRQPGVWTKVLQRRPCQSPATTLMSSASYPRAQNRLRGL